MVHMGGIVNGVQPSILKQGLCFFPSSKSQTLSWKIFGASEIVEVLILDWYKLGVFSLAFPPSGFVVSHCKSPTLPVVFRLESEDSSVFHPPPALLLPFLGTSFFLSMESWPGHSLPFSDQLTCSERSGFQARLEPVAGLFAGEGGFSPGFFSPKLCLSSEERFAPVAPDKSH